MRVKDSANNSAASGEHDALINRVAQEMAGGKNNGLMSFDKAPDSALSRYGLTVAKGIAAVPEGVVHAVVHDIKNPGETLATVATAAATTAALKFVLPEGTPVGRVAGAAIGAYFTYQAAKPIISGIREGGNATTMQEINLAATKIGDAGGNFIVGSAVAGVGAKFGAMGADRILATDAMSGFKTARANFYDNLTAKVGGVTDAMGITSSGNVDVNRLNFKPEAYGVIPPYMLEELAKRNPENGDFLKAYNKTVELENKPGSPIHPNSQTDNHGFREVYDANGTEELPGTKARFEGEKATGNNEVDKAYDFTGVTREFYQKEYGRNSIDGKGMKFVSTVNYGENYENAFWNGSQMTYGKPGPDSPFKTFMILDVAGHEITHGVTEMESNLEYRGQSGALNESLSDVYGNLIKQYANHETADKADWLVGGGIWKDNVKGRGLRDMLNPGTAYDDPSIGKDPQPAHMKDYYRTQGDNGGVHYNSGIPNKAFATFAKAVGGNAWDDPGHIWFKARETAGSNPSFAQFAFQTVEAAKSMGKTDLVPKLIAAWEGVGVTPNAKALDTITPAAPVDNSGIGSALARLFSFKKAS